jgi:hypothetical protein
MVIAITSSAAAVSESDLHSAPLAREQAFHPSSSSGRLCMLRLSYFEQYLVVLLKYGMGFSNRRIRG